MLSVIIPTMWFHRESLIKIIDELTTQSIVGEIIVIHNNKLDYDIQSLNQDKLLSIIPPKNIGCNPAWNIGAKIAKFDKLFILNDDFYFDFSVCEKIEPHITTDKGLILADTNSSVEDAPRRLSPKDWPGDWIAGWACGFFVHKEVYLDNLIPDKLILHCGDNWLLDTIGKPHYTIKGVSFPQKFSGSIERVRGLPSNHFLYVESNGDERLYDDMKQKYIRYCKHTSSEEIIL